ncbi:MAG: NAD(P)H-dependent oxidoreductase subunit E [Deltaproteobacteria bacterium]|jgi:NADH-quinone oxidoreductase subunit E|nr:NAD(P)H-dependent oxidoreductase subunit E [Deltaproteobacteria bacterium]
MQELTEGQVLKIMESYGNDPQQLIAVLLDIQAASGKNFVEQKWSILASKVLGVPLSKIYDILTFYAMFSTIPRGEHVIEICQSTPCHFIQAEQVVGWFEEVLGVKVGATTDDGRFTLFRTSCVGACDVGPVAKIGDDVFGELTLDKVKTLVQSYRDGQPNRREALTCQS